MQSKIYLLTFDPKKIDPVMMHGLIKNNPTIQDWWHYLEPTYLIKSNYTLATISNQIHTHLPSQHFLMIEINPYNNNGWLPKAAWGWINTRR